VASHLYEEIRKPYDKLLAFLAPKSLG